jgi:hypothetical protein
MVDGNQNVSANQIQVCPETQKQLFANQFQGLDQILAGMENPKAMNAVFA